MTANEAMPSLRTAIGEAVRTLRETAGVTADEVARIARGNYGLAWTRSKVAELERGEKAISAEEFLVLPALLSDALDRKVALADLVSGKGRVALAGRVAADAANIRAALGTGDPYALNRVWIGTPDLGVAIVAGITRLQEMVPAIQRAAGRTDILNTEVEQIQAEAGEAERKAARNLGVSVLEVGLAARSLWGRSLTDERERLVAERLKPNASARTRQAVRGRVTRELRAQLQDRFNPEA